MEPQKFIKSYKCDCFQPDNYCNCPNRIVSTDILLQNVTETAAALIEVMKLCGISMEKTRDISKVIIYFFLHFEEVIQRIDAVPRKRLNKEDLMHDLGRKCLMNRAEAQMAYSIIKRAFKAFYHGTGLGGVPNVLLKNQLTHTSECLWEHAAQRTAQAYASYEGLFHAAQKDLECKIKQIYKDLHDRISSRDQPDDNHECVCTKCAKRIARETLKAVESIADLHLLHHPFEGVYLKEQATAEQADGKGYEAVSISKTPCSCRSLKGTKKDCEYQKSIESTKISSDQPPFECKWISISKEEFEAGQDDTYLKPPEELPSDYECTCEECTCISDCKLEDGMDTEAEKDEISMPSDNSSTSVHGFYDDAIF